MGGPFYAYYGIQMQRAIDNYPVGEYRERLELIRAIGMLKKAAITNRKLKMIDATRARAITRAADEVISGKCNDQFAVEVYQAGGGRVVPYEC